MSAFTIYAIRLHGELEVRYVGQSADPIRRICGHFSEAKTRPHASQFYTWLTDNTGNVEWVALDHADTRAEAKAAERAAIKLCLALGNRLFNRNFVPAALRISDASESIAA